MTMVFRNRDDAGRLLAERLDRFSGPETIVCALPRGGVPVAVQIARRLGAPLTLLFVRKIGAPGHQEFAIGAIVDGETPARILQQDAIDALKVNDRYIAESCDAAMREIDRRKALYRGLCPPIPLKGKTAIIVDDGLATGASMEAAIKAAKASRARTVVAAVPVGLEDAVVRLAAIADEIICLETPAQFRSVSQSYDSFPQLDDADVMAILSDASPANGGGARASLSRKRA